MSKAKFDRTRSAFIKLLAGVVIASGATGAFAQEEVFNLEQVVVTGTNIRGVAPVGANVISVDRPQFETSGAQSIQQILRDVPQLTGFNNLGQGGFGSADNSGTFAPTIHSLGASASNSTLILVDGHRLPLSGLNHTLADPNIIPPAALQRVEVLPDGASAVYGSDAVAGVVNFITRRGFDGVESSAQVGVGDAYHTVGADFVAGHAWDGGSAMAAYGYSFRSNLAEDDRTFVRTDLREFGGQNFKNLNCFPAAVMPLTGPGANRFFEAPYTGAPLVEAPCDIRAVTNLDIVPEVERHSVMARIDQKLTDRLTATLDGVWSRRVTHTNIARGNLSAVGAFGSALAAPGGAAQVNPFFTGPAGSLVEAVYLNFDQLFGPGAYTDGGSRSMYANLGLDYDLGRGWNANLTGLVGRDHTFLRIRGQVCQPCAILALNGTTQANGNPSPSVLPPGIPAGAKITNFPLTTANALDVWRPAGQNRTSADVLARLLDSDQDQESRHGIETARLAVSGPLVSLPSGDVRVSVGGESLHYSLDQANTTVNLLGPASENRGLFELSYTRQVYAAFAEAVIPIVGGRTAQPWLQRLDLSLAVRYDDYSDFGSTTNPRVAFTLQPVDDITFRGSYGTSFTAPALTSRGDRNGTTTESTYAASAEQIVPATFPGVTGLPGCNPVPATGCRIGGSNPAQGLFLAGGNKNLRPSEGDTYSLGVDVRPRLLRGLSASVTWWRARYDGLITAPTFAAVTTNPALYDALIINPTQAQIDEAVRYLRPNSAIPSKISFINSFQQRNAFDLDASGIDVSIRYRQPTDRMGDFTFGLDFSDKLTFKQRVSPATPWVDNLNVAGVNATFSSLKFSGRASLDWRLQGWRAGLAMNYVNPYWARTSNNIALFGPKGQRVGSYTTFDLDLSYAFSAPSGLFHGLQLYLDAENLFDRDPPYVNIPGGYNDLEANPIGQLVSFGLRKRW